MDFALSEEQERLRDAARELLAAECPMERVRKIAAEPSGHDAALWRAFAEAGWLGVLVPDALGGAGLGLLDAAVLLHELGRAVAPGPFLASSVAAVVALREAGTRAQQERWLPALAAGEAIATVALFEGLEARPDGGALRDRAARRGGGFLLDGTRPFVPYGHLADLVLAAFRTARASAGAGYDGVSLFAVPGDAKGLKKELLVSVDETRRECELRLRGVQLPREALLERRERAAGAARASGAGPLVARVLDACAVAIAAESLGGAERALERAVEYVKVREQFGRPVGSFQAVQHMAAEAAARIEPARALVWYAAWAFDARPKDAPLAAAMAKAACCDVYRAVARTAVEMHGGIGFTWENDMHFYLKRSLANAAAFGDGDWHRERVAELSHF
ncbi:MAG TPA: acyl-CoA dehydrogenase [Myxococcota bacterium]|nr:acyl-CoA dehydrogenase [Myxococcota bacterium]